MIMSPEVMSSRPTIIRSRVDFPHPDGPTRIMNSPSAMSRLTSLTAGNPSPYFLTTCFMVISAMGALLLGCLASALDGAGGEPRHDPALEGQDQDHDGDGDDDRRGHDGGDGRLELRATGEERERGRHGAGPVGRGEGDGQQELVPAE